jgi:hypothetical protein
MSPITFPCVVTSIEGTKPITRRRTWIGGHDFRALVLAATTHIGASPETCTYTLFSPDGRDRGVFLELIDRRVNIDAHVGPMSGPVPPASLGVDRYWTFHDFLTLLGFSPTHGGPNTDDAYAVMVRDTGIWNASARRPERGLRETPEQFKRRVEAADRAHLDRARHEGMHLVRYAVPPKRWTARDLEQVMRLAYRTLPVSEPRWRDSGTLSQRGAEAGRSRIELGNTAGRFSLEVGRGDYVASVQLPCFPVLALAEWLAKRPCDIHLRHPVGELEAPRVRGAARNQALAS